MAGSAAAGHADGGRRHRPHGHAGQQCHALSGGRMGPHSSSLQHCTALPGPILQDYSGNNNKVPVLCICSLLFWIVRIYVHFN
mgnify:CR=1 FL=1